MESAEPQPDFIGIGASKSATSWIARCLSEHPDICLYQGKEVHFFDTEENYAKGMQWYVTHFTQCRDDQLTGEYTPTYLAHPDAPERIKANCPDVKLICCLRHPVERVLSSIEHQYVRGYLPADMDVADALKQCPQLLAGGRYAAALERYFALFDREQILILFYEDIATDPVAFMNRVYNFLGVDSYSPDTITEKINTSADRRSTVYWYIQRIYLQLQQWQAGRAAVSVGKALGARSLVRRMVSATAKSGHNYFDESRARKLLEKHLSSEVDELESLLQEKITQWR
jgi:DNA-binding NarL/FixJ family response regulator